MSEFVSWVPVPQETLAIASMLRRVGAWIIDMVLLLVAVSIVAAALGAWRSSTNSWIGPGGSVSTSTVYYLDTIWSESLLAILSAAYVIPCWTVWGATIGQRMLGLKVFDVAGPTRLTLARSIVRWAVLFGWTAPGIASYFNGVFTAVSLGWLIALLVAAAVNERKQGLHDRAARSLVVSRSRQWIMAPYVVTPPNLGSSKEIGDPS